MAVTARPEISKILLDLGIEPVDVYAVDNAEKTYISALIEGINTLEVANKGESTRSQILRDELKRLREKKRKVNVDKLFARKQVIPTNRIRPQALLPGSADDEKKGGMDGKTNSILDSIIGILKIGNKQDKKEATIEQKERAKERRKTRENLLESTKGIAKVGKKLVDKIVSPFSNILNAIGNFLKFVLAGYLFNVLFSWFTDKDNQKKIATLTRFFKDWWPALAGGALLFLTPLGLIVGGLVGFLSWALPALTSLIAANPWLAGVALFTAPAWITKLFPSLGKSGSDQAVDKSISEIGRDATLTSLSTEYDEKLLKFQDSKNPFTKAKLNDELLEIQKQINRVSLLPQNNNQNNNQNNRQFKKGGMTKGPSHTQGGTDINVEGGEFILRKKATKFWGVRTLNAMNKMGGMSSPTRSKRKKVKPQLGGGVNYAATGANGQYKLGGFVGIKNMFNKTSTIPFTSDDKGKFISSRAKGMVAIDIPVNQQNTKTVVLPEKRIAKQNQAPTKIGSKTIPDILIVNRSHQREMITRSLGIHDLVGV